MEKIASFTIDHLRLMPGLYVSRRDGDITTFDMRMTRPNFEPVMGTEAVHAIEHLGATFLRNHPQWKNSVIYFGPMGCRTGFYLLMNGYLQPEDIVSLVKDMFVFIAGYEGEIPGACAKDCGNYLDMNLSTAKFFAEKYLREFLNEPETTRMRYPED